MLGLFAGTAAPLHSREWENQTGLFYLDGSDFDFEHVGWFKKGFFRQARPLLDRQVSGMGYAGITSSLAVEFDTWQNAWDPFNDEISIHVNGDRFNDIGSVQAPLNLNSGETL